MDILAVREAIRWSKEYCNAGRGPLMLEMATYRYSGHSMSDPGTSYRTREDIQEVRKARDPIIGFKDKIVAGNLCTEDELKNIDKEVRKEVEVAHQEAISDDLLPIEALHSDLYANTEPIMVRGAIVEETKKQPYATTNELLKKLGVPIKATVDSDIH